MRRAEYNDLALKKLPARRLVSWLAAAVLAPLLAIGALSLPWHGERQALAPVVLSSARGSGPLRAGAATASIDLPAGSPIGGFARLAWRSEGIRDPVGASALVLEAGGIRVAIVATEVLLITEPLRRRVEQLLSGLELDAVLVGATHTHAGPGGYWDDVAAERSALGPYDAAALERIAGSVAGAVRRAAGSTRPALLSAARGSAKSLVRARSGGEIDGRLLSLRVSTTGGEPLAELLVFAAHPTTLGKVNRRISGDWPGRLMAAPGAGVRLMLQGAVGDQSAQVPPGDAATRPERYAEAVLAADAALGATSREPAPLLAVATVSVTLPALEPGAVPRLLRRAAATLAWNRMPSTARITALRVGPELLVAVPCEPTAQIGERWRAESGANSEILSLVDGWIGYVDDAARVRRGEGETVRTYYGPELAERLGQGVAAAARAVAP
jgi:hypothetical protein